MNDNPKKSLLVQCQEAAPHVPWTPVSIAYDERELPVGESPTVVEEVVRCGHVIVRRSGFQYFATVPTQTMDPGPDVAHVLRQLPWLGTHLLLIASLPPTVWHQPEGTRTNVRVDFPAHAVEPDAQALVAADAASADLLAIQRYARRLKLELEDANAQIAELKDRLGLIGDDPTKPIIESLRARASGSDVYAGADSYQDVTQARVQLTPEGRHYWWAKNLETGDVYDEAAKAGVIQLNASDYPEGTVLLVSRPADTVEAPAIELGEEA